MTRPGDQITTTEELDALPVGAVVLDLGPDRSLDNAPVIACKAADGMWHITGTPKDRRWRHHEIIRDADGSVLIAAHIPGHEARSPFKRCPRAQDCTQPCPYHPEGEAT